MTIYYLDTSALVKLYVSETGSRWVEDLVRVCDASGLRKNTIVFSKVAIVETCAAIGRRARTRNITPDTQYNLYQDFLTAVSQDFTTLALTDEIIFKASELTQQYPLRGYDAVHLASALSFDKILQAVRTGPLLFVSADAILLQAADDEGLTTDDPDNHP